MWQEEASGVWRHEAEPGSSGRPGQPARLPEPPEPECGAEWDAGRVSESESVPTWDPRWLQPVTWWPGGPVTSDKPPWPVRLVTLWSSWQGHPDCHHEQRGGRGRWSGAWARGGGRTGRRGPPGPVCGALQAGENTRQRTNRLVPS